MLDSRKDEAKSDKWMALAQAGMALYARWYRFLRW
jgi:hypothetical protein